VLDRIIAGGYPEGELGLLPGPGRPANLDLPRFPIHRFPTIPDPEICTMVRKWLVFALSAGILVSLGVGAGFTRAQEEKESELEKIMEQVQKHNLVITKGTRNAVYFKKSQKDVEKSAKELVKLAKKAKPIKDALKNAKDEKEPGKRWDELLEALATNCEKLGEVTGKPDATLKQAKDAFNVVKKNCSDCHAIFRVDETKF
jgi:hypothetical protein